MQILTKHCVVYLLIAMLIAPFNVLPPTAHAAGAIPTTYFNGNIYTMEDTPETVEVVVADANGRILFAGARADATSAGYFGGGYKQVDLTGYIMLPGFVEPFGDFPGTYAENIDYNANSTRIVGVDLSGLTTKAAVIAAIKAKLGAVSQNTFVSAMNYDPSKFATQLVTTDIAASVFGGNTNLSIELVHISKNMKLVNDTLRAQLITDGTNSGTAPTAADSTTLVFSNSNKVVVFKAATSAAGMVSAKEYHGIELVDDLINAADLTPASLTGVLRGHQAISLVGPPPAVAGSSSTPPAQFPAKDADILTARGMQLYAAAGVTTASMRGSILSKGGTYSPSVADIRNFMISNEGRNIRVVTHPLTAGAVENLEGEDARQGANHLALAWTNSSTPLSGETATGNTPNALATVGSDVTNWNTNTWSGSAYTTPGAVFTSSAETSFATANPYMLMLGTWEQYLDGTILDATGYMTEYVVDADKFPVDTIPNLYGAAGAFQWDPVLNTQVTTNTDFRGLIPSFNLNVVDDSLNDAAGALRTSIRIPYHNAGEAVATHTSGNLANQMMGAALTAANIAGTNEVRHAVLGLEVQNLTGSSAIILAAGKTAVNPTLSFAMDQLYYWGAEYVDALDTALGNGAKDMLPLEKALDNSDKLTYTIHQSPGTKVNPLVSVFTAVKREARGTTGTLGNAIDMLSAWKAVTINAAYANKLEEYIGSIKVGKQADFVILNRNPFAPIPTFVPEFLLSGDTKLVTTIVANKVVFGFLPNTTIFVSPPTIPDKWINSAIVSNIMFTTPPTLIGAESADAGAFPNSVVLPAEAANAYNFGMYEFEADVTYVTPSPTIGAFTYFEIEFRGNGRPASDMQLYKQRASGVEVMPFTYITNPTTTVNVHDGTYWITSLDDLDTVLGATDTVRDNIPYLLTFVVQDAINANTPNAFDRNISSGKIEDPFILASLSGAAPTDNSIPPVNTDFTGSCTIGTSPSYDLALLLFALASVVGIRRIRRKA